MKFRCHKALKHFLQKRLCSARNPERSGRGKLLPTVSWGIDLQQSKRQSFFQQFVDKYIPRGNFNWARRTSLLSNAKVCVFFNGCPITRCHLTTNARPPRHLQSEKQLSRAQCFRVALNAINLEYADGALQHVVIIHAGHTAPKQISSAAPQLKPSPIPERKASLRSTRRTLRCSQLF